MAVQFDALKENFKMHFKPKQCIKNAKVKNKRFNRNFYFYQNIYKLLKVTK